MMKFERNQLSYRPGVIGIVIDEDQNFLVVQMNDYDDDQWRFSGGGIENGEVPKVALLRELEEELGSTNFEVLKKSKFFNQYDWPDGVIVNEFHKRKKWFRGQRQFQFLVKFVGKKSEIVLDPSELKAIKWVKYENLKDHFVFDGQWSLADRVIRELLGYNI